MLHFRETLQTEPSVSAPCPAPELTIIKAFLALYFDQWATTCPVQWKLCSCYYSLICIYTDQSEWLQ